MIIKMKRGTSYTSCFSSFFFFFFLHKECVKGGGILIPHVRQKGTVSEFLKKRK